MRHPSQTLADIDRTATWTRYRRTLCEQCAATCCRLPVEVKPPDLVRLGLIDRFDLAEEPRLIARKLLKRRQIDHFHGKTATFTLARSAGGECLFLDPAARRCTVYHQRPDTCRNHPQVGPRPGYCPFNRKQAG